MPTKYIFLWFSWSLQYLHAVDTRYSSHSLLLQSPVKKIIVLPMVSAWRTDRIMDRELWPTKLWWWILYFHEDLIECDTLYSTYSTYSKYSTYSTYSIYFPIWECPPSSVRTSTRWERPILPILPEWFCFSDNDMIYRPAIDPWFLYLWIMYDTSYM